MKNLSIVIYLLFKIFTGHISFSNNEFMFNLEYYISEKHFMLLNINLYYIFKVFFVKIANFLILIQII